MADFESIQSSPYDLSSVSAFPAEEEYQTALCAQECEPWMAETSDCFELVAQEQPGYELPVFTRTSLCCRSNTPSPLMGEGRGEGGSGVTGDDVALGVVIGGCIYLGGPVAWGVAALVIAACHSVPNVGDPAGEKKDQDISDGSAPVSRDAANNEVGRDADLPADAGSDAPDCVSRAEICNGEDDDCDRDIDEDIPDEFSGTDEGRCRQEISGCRGGVWRVVQEEIPPATELCNATDDDCDGFINEEIPDEITGTDEGECQRGIRTCGEGGWEIVQEEIPPETEIPSDGIDNDCNGVTDPEPLSWLEVSAGYFHTCGVGTGGVVACWGRNVEDQSTPPEGTFTQVSAGSYHTCAVKMDNTVECWGADSRDQSSPPAGAFTQVSSGWFHTCGITIDNIVECWGSDEDLDGGFIGQAIPPEGTFTQVSAGNYHTCGITTDDALECWGSNVDFSGDFIGQSTPPEGTFTQVSAGAYHTCGVRTDETVACWGRNVYGEADPPEGTFIQVSAGGRHTCGITTDNTVECWGSNIDFGSRFVGQATPPEGTFIQVSVGGWHSCGITTDDTVECWGSDNNGQSTPPSP